MHGIFKQQSASFYGVYADKPRGMLLQHEKNSKNTSHGRVIYEFSECSNIPSGLSAYTPKKLVIYCFYKIIQRTRDFQLVYRYNKP